MEIMNILKQRFIQNMNRHPQLDWAAIEQRLQNNRDACQSLEMMEASGGEPDVIDYHQDHDLYLFVDCAKESPSDRRSCCFDEAALAARKANKPQTSAEALAKQMNITILDETMYRYLQTLGDFDCKTSSWIATPSNIRKLGGALFADKRYDTVFVYHNGADSYYGARGFRGYVWV